jgi:hypothetical protein
MGYINKDSQYSQYIGIKKIQQDLVNFNKAIVIERHYKCPPPCLFHAHFYLSLFQ